MLSVPCYISAAEQGAASGSRMKESTEKPLLVIEIRPY